jgi:hypothetical protein
MRIQPRAEAGDVTLPHQAAEAVAHRGWRQPDALREFGVADASVALQLGKNPSIGFIQVRHNHGKSALMPFKLRKSRKIGNGVTENRH